MLEWSRISRNKSWVPGQAQSCFILPEACRLDIEWLKSARSLADTKIPHPFPWLKLSSALPETDELFQCINAVKLPSECHKLPSISQQITRPIQEAERERDFRIRQRAAAAVSGDMSIKLAINTVEKLANQNVFDQEVKCSLSKLQSFLEGTAAANKQIVNFHLREVATSKLRLRKEACEPIKEVDVSEALIQDHLFSPSLFHLEAVKMVENKIEKPALRSIKVQSNNSFTIPRIKPSKPPFRSQRCRPLGRLQCLGNWSGS